MIRVDMHVHSAASFDCVVEPERMLARCRRIGLDRVFLTDHDTISAAVRMRERESRAVVVGQEISTADGELIGLFLERPVPRDLSADATADRIKEQGGLVYLEHAYDRARRCLRAEAIERIADRIDIVEVFNPRSGQEANGLAEDLCATLDAAAGAGSDAHRLQDIGCGFVEMEDFDGPQDFLCRLRRARVVRRPNQVLLMIRSRLARR